MEAPWLTVEMHSHPIFPDGISRHSESKTECVPGDVRNALMESTPSIAGNRDNSKESWVSLGIELNAAFHGQRLAYTEYSRPTADASLLAVVPCCNSVVSYIHMHFKHFVYARTHSIYWKDSAILEVEGSKFTTLS